MVEMETASSFTEVSAKYLICAPFHFIQYVQSHVIDYNKPLGHVYRP